MQGLPLSILTASSEVILAQAVATQVLTIARAEPPLASRAEPALKPNQPNHSSEAPIMVKVKLCGAIDSRP